MKLNKKTIWDIKHKKTVSSTDEIIDIILANRGIKGKKNTNEFLNPLDPYEISLSKVGISSSGVSQAITRIKQAIAKQELIIVYGDYDADGITGTAILWECLHQLGVRVMPFIPQRDQHGYGLNKKGIDSILKKYQTKKPKLIITVDNGIVAFDGTDYCRQLGIDLIITDHHQKKTKDKMPVVSSVVWSDQISGSAVAWFLARELWQENIDSGMPEFKQSNSLELAAIGTITDMMPLVSVNRSIVFFGLKEINQSERIGVKAIIDNTDIKDRKLGTYEISFILGPRINAMGRIADALDSLRLLCTKDTKRASALARTLGLTNQERQDVTRQNLSKADEIIKKNKLRKNKILFLIDKSFNPGVVGLVAGKLVEKYCLPSMVIAIDNGMAKGSVRSVRGFNIIEFLRQFDKYFDDLGGHPMAAGFNISTKNLAKLEKAILSKANTVIKDEQLIPRKEIDCELSFSDLTWDLHKKIMQLKPFGIANSQPVFVSRGVQVLDFRSVGRELKHLKLKLKVGGTVIDAIAFGFGGLAGELSSKKTINLVYSLDKNVWNGRKSLQLMVKDIRFTF